MNEAMKNELKTILTRLAMGHLKEVTELQRGWLIVGVLASWVALGHEITDPLGNIVPDESIRNEAEKLRQMIVSMLAENPATTVNDIVAAIEGYIRPS